MSYEKDHLYHWGIKGMRWGVRRFQNKDGTLTPLGKKRDRAKNNKDSANSSPKKTSGSKSVKDMSDQELKSKVDRLSMEQRYLDLNKQIKNLNTENTSAGKKFVSRLMDNVITPAAEDVAKQLVKSYMTESVNKMFNLPDHLKVYTNNKKK